MRIFQRGRMRGSDAPRSRFQKQPKAAPPPVPVVVVTRQARSSTAVKLEAVLQKIQIPGSLLFGGHAHNTSVAVYDGRLLAIVRVSTRDHGTINLLGVIATDGDTSRLAYARVCQDVATHERHPTPYKHGYEDCRLFKWKQKLFAVASTYEGMASGGAARIALLELSYSGDVLSDSMGDVLNVRVQPGNRIEKNWMPVVDTDEQLRFIYSVDAGLSLCCDTVPPNIPVPVLRGGSQLIPFGDAYIAIVHEVHGNEVRVYEHRFVLFDKDLRVLRQSIPFYFKQPGVEFCAGLAAWQDGFVASFGFEDCEPWLAHITQETACRILGIALRDQSIVVHQDRLLVCHSSQERCGIREYGRQLDVSLSKLASVQSFTFKDFDKLEQTAQPNSVVLVHYEPMLVPSGFTETLRALRARRVRIIFCCHWYAIETLSAYQDVVDAFVVHRPCSDPTPPRTDVIPLGCPTYTPTESRDALRARMGFLENDIVVTTLGFLARWKQVPQTLDVLLSQAKDPRLLFQIQMPWHFSDQDTSRAEDTTVRAVMARYPQARVRFSTEFLSEKELLDRVYASDLGFLFHGQHTNSVSAATKQFVSARCPLVITESTHGADLRGGVVRVPGFDPAHFASEVLRVAGDVRIRDELQTDMKNEYDRINMDTVAGEYIKLVRSL